MNVEFATESGFFKSGTLLEIVNKSRVVVIDETGCRWAGPPELVFHDNESIARTDMILSLN